MQPLDRETCPDCDNLEALALDRRGFLRGVAAAGIATALPLLPVPRAQASPTPKSPAETAVKALYDTLTDKQKKAICFDWDYKHQQRGLLRTHVSNNWHVVDQTIASDFYTAKQKGIILDIFKSLFNPDWHKRLFKQLEDDSGGKFGTEQNIAIFGKPGEGKFELVMTGRHLTTRVDGNSEPHVAFGGPIFHGHAASGFNEKVGHPGNVFWHQAKLANKVYQILDPKQEKKALVLAKRPAEFKVPLQGKSGTFPGLPIKEMSRDQKEAVEKVLLSLVEPYRKEDVDEVKACLQAQGGLDACSLAFYKDGDLGNDGEWDNWRIEGPAFVWYFRGFPHVHIWINVADDSSPVLNSRNL